MKTFFRNQKIEVEAAGRGVLLLACRDYLLCRQLNRIVRTYGAYVHKPGEEGQFRITDLTTLAEVLRIPPFKGMTALLQEEIKNYVKVGDGTPLNSR